MVQQGLEVITKRHCVLTTITAILGNVLKEDVTYKIISDPIYHMEASSKDILSYFWLFDTSYDFTVLYELIVVFKSVEFPRILILLRCTLFLLDVGYCSTSQLPKFGRS